MSTLEITPPAARAGALPRHLIESLVLARRTLAHVRQTPERLIQVTLQPIMFVLLFGYVFGGAIAIPGGHYRQYLIGGVLIQTIAFAMFTPALHLAADLTEGIVDRFRTLPMSRGSFLLGHMLAGVATMSLMIAVVTVTGHLTGWGIHTDLPHAAAGYLLLFACGFTLLWLGALIGVSVRTPDAVMGLGMTVVFPLTFTACTYVPLTGMSPGLRQLAEVNPITCFATAVRSLFGNPTALPDSAPWTVTHPVLSSLAWCALLLTIAIPLALRGFRARTED
jgi:ABC-2 type transport system permease protein